MKKLHFLLLALAVCLSFNFTNSQRKSKLKKTYPKKIDLGAFEFRNVGPAFLSGRIADIAIHPSNGNIWYVAVGSGGVWKTKNSGTTWDPIFDDEKSYSIGCITVDSSNPEIIWVGTGENVGGRHVGYGDGVYKSIDDGKTWVNMGLKTSEHISKIIVHPDNSDIVWVASQGPLWKKGGERGLFKTINGGKTWKRTLGNSQWTGVTDLMIDPRNPDVLYAATWDRHRTVAAYLGGGPGSGIHRSLDGGETWSQLSNGLPYPNKNFSMDQEDDEDEEIIYSNIGKIGLAISPQNPDVIYAALELDRRTGALYRSENRGGSWEKMSDVFLAYGTGPHYYQELYASPHKFDRLYLVNVRVQTSEDGGKTFTQLKESKKHSDNHSIIFKEDDPDYIMIGTDAGIYETFDLAENWSYIKNLPLTQFYKVAVNDAKPFYHIFGGTQDNGSAGGPSATDEREGISNRNWYKILGADGHQTATDPEYNNIVYAETQQGGLHRVDLLTGETLFIQPQAEEGDPHERFNWDAPILVSPHDPATLYFGSYRVWKSKNRGDDWTPISGDLTRNEERITLPIMGRKQSWDNPWDISAMSTYNTITSLSESPLKEGLIYAGTDDGFIQVTSNGGDSWTKIPVTQLGLPGRTFINDIKADLHDVNTVYVCLDNHKEGDLNPYIFKSTDQGKTWKSISSNLPKRTLIWRLVQDPIAKNLFFAATEFGIYTSVNSGVSWQKLPGTPNSSFRDLVIQKRENDLVAASFGRGFYVLDDYSALREMTPENLNKTGVLFKPRTAKWFVPRSKVGNTGADYYFAKNPKFGAVFTYHLSNDYPTQKEIRKQRERSLNKRLQNITFPGWSKVDKEIYEAKAKVWLSISDLNGNIIRNISKTAKKGSDRIAWDLRHPSNRSIGSNSRYGSNSGPIASPGNYNASLYLEHNGKISKLDGPIEFEVKPIREGVLKGVSYDEYNSYKNELSAIQNQVYEVNDLLKQSLNKISDFKKALSRIKINPGELNSNIFKLENTLREMNLEINGSDAKKQIGEKRTPTIQNRLSVAQRGLSTTYGPTMLHKKSMNLASKGVKLIKPKVEKIYDEDIPKIKNALIKAGSPYLNIN